jgi:hypothetical protein
MKTICAIILLAFTTCYGQHEEPTILGGDGANRFLQVELSGLFASSLYYTVADNRLLFEQFDPVRPYSHARKLAARNLVTVSDSQLEKFWTKIDLLQIDRWKLRYDDRELGAEVLHPKFWRLVLRTGTKEKRSAGNNVFPAVSPIGQPTLKIGEDGKLIENALDVLIGALDDLQKNK